MDQGLLAFIIDGVEGGIRFLIRVFLDMMAHDFAGWVLLLGIVAAGYVVWRKISRRR